MYLVFLILKIFMQNPGMINDKKNYGLQEVRLCQYEYNSHKRKQLFQDIFIYIYTYIVITTIYIYLHITKSIQPLKYG